MNAAIDRFLQMLSPSWLSRRHLPPSPAVQLTEAEFAALVRAGDLIFYDGGGAPTHTPVADTRRLSRTHLARFLASLIELLPCAPFALVCCAEIGDSEIDRGEDELGGAPNKPHNRPVVPHEWCDWSSAALVVRVDGPNVVLLATERSFDAVTLRELVTAPESVQSSGASQLFAVRHLVISEEANLMGAPEHLAPQHPVVLSSAQTKAGAQRANAALQSDATTARWRVNIAERIGSFSKTVAQRAALIARGDRAPSKVRRDEALALAAMRRSGAFGSLYALYIAHVFRSEPRIVDAPQILQLSGGALSQRMADAYEFTDARCFRLML